ncbi:hypothetical protein GC174_10575 [bacterium]|nr:hypothetical protein [bacterium]
MVNTATYRRVLLGLVFLSSTVFVAPEAMSLEGRVEHSKAAGKARRTGPIQGGIKDDATLNPSVRVLPGQGGRASSSSATPDFSGELVQYSGSRQSGPGARFAPHYPTPITGFPGRSNVIPPITDYHMRSRNGIMTFGGHGVIVSPSHQGISTFRAGSGASIPHSVKGVTVFDPGYGTTVVTPSSRDNFPSSYHEVSTYRYRRTGGGGSLGLWAPGEASIHNLLVQSNPVQSRKGITTWISGYEVGQSGGDSTGRTTVITPGASSTQIASTKGVSTWVPGYEVTVNDADGYKTGLGGRWSADRGGPSGLSADPALRMPDPIFAQPVVRDPLHAGHEGPLIAKAGILPQLKNSSFSDNITWKDWYNTVASAIYSRWKNMEVGPGTAKVEVVINKNRAVTARVLDFFPAPLAERNVDQETEFRISALKSVNRLEPYEIPSFPPNTDEGPKDEVKFSVMLKRTVDGPIGVDLSKL